MNDQKHYFLAISLPKEIKNYIKQKLKKQSLSFKSLVHEEDYHMTLVFLGAVTNEKRAALNEELLSLSTERSFRLSLGSIGYFGREERPRVLWVGVNKIQELYSLQEKVKKICELVGFEVDKRPYTPHITVARKFNGECKFILEESLNFYDNIEWLVDKVVLFETNINNVPKYKNVGQFFLGQ